MIKFYERKPYQFYSSTSLCSSLVASSSLLFSSHPNSANFIFPVSSISLLIVASAFCPLSYISLKHLSLISSVIDAGKIPTSGLNHFYFDVFVPSSNVPLSHNTGIWCDSGKRSFMASIRSGVKGTASTIFRSEVKERNIPSVPRDTTPIKLGSWRILRMIPVSFFWASVSGTGMRNGCAGLDWCFGLRRGFEFNLGV